MLFFVDFFAEIPVAPVRANRNDIARQFSDVIEVKAHIKKRALPVRNRIPTQMFNLDICHGFHCKNP